MTLDTHSEVIAESKRLGLELPPLTESEAIRRIPMLDPTTGWITDDERRTDVLSLVRFAPAYFWLRPASYAGYHSPYRHGLWAHTLGVVLAIETFAASRVHQGRLTSQQVEQARAAAILHDMRKSGPTPGDTRGDHDSYMAQVIAEQTDLSPAVSAAVDEHMGPWGAGSDPHSPVSRLLHDADLVASGEQHGVQFSLPEPVPAELTSPPAVDSRQFDGRPPSRAKMNDPAAVSVSPEIVCQSEDDS